MCVCVYTQYVHIYNSNRQNNACVYFNLLHLIFLSFLLIRSNLIIIIKRDPEVSIRRLKDADAISHKSLNRILIIINSFSRGRRVQINRQSNDKHLAHPL